MTGIAADTASTATARLQLRYIWTALIWGLLVGPILISFALPVSYDAQSGNDLSSLASEPTRGAVQSAAINGVHFTVLAICAGAVVFATRFAGPLRDGFGLWLSAMLLSVGTVISSIFSTGVLLPPDVIRLPLLFTAVYVLPPVNLEWFARRCKSVIELYVIVTFAAMIVAPSRVLQMSYDAGLVDALSFRLHGIANHANNFAPILLTYIILGWLVPARSKREYASLILIIAALLLSQSKTVIIALLAMSAVRLMFSEGGTRYLVGYAGAVATVGGLLALTIVKPTWDRGLVDFFIADNEFTTLTGRTTVWEYALDLWESRPIVGYGIDHWYIEMSENFAQLYGWVPHHAHNQLIQSLGESGIVGAVGLLIFAVALVVNAFKFRRITCGVSLGLVGFLVLRSLTEAPISGALDENLFVLFVTFVILLLASRSADEPENTELPARPAPVATTETDRLRAVNRLNRGSVVASVLR